MPLLVNKLNENPHLLGVAFFRVDKLCLFRSFFDFLDAVGNFFETVETVGAVTREESRRNVENNERSIGVGLMTTLLGKSSQTFSAVLFSSPVGIASELERNVFLLKTGQQKCSRLSSSAIGAHGFHFVFSRFFGISSPTNSVRSV